MVDLKRIIEAEKENVEKALVNLLHTMERKDKTIVELAAIATFLHNIYSGMENILKGASRNYIFPSKLFRAQKKLSP